MVSIRELIDVPAKGWSGRFDGEGVEHLRWHQKIRPLEDLSGEIPQAVILGFASDEGVERNQGRRGAAAGPAAIRAALGSLPILRKHSTMQVADLGDVAVTDDRLEEGQERLGEVVAAVIDAGALPVVFGGGHEIAFATYRGVAQSQVRAHGGAPLKVGVLNLDAHFDLRSAGRATSGTGFRQLLDAEAEAGTQVSYGVLGISETANTQILFDAAQEYGVRYLLDTDCTPGNRQKVLDFVADFVADIDLLYLTIDLDVLPAATAPGVSAPAAYGVSQEIIEAVCDAVAQSPKLTAVDIAELNPRYDIDGRTAKVAARLAHRITTQHCERKAK